MSAASPNWGSEMQTTMATSATGGWILLACYAVVCTLFVLRVWHQQRRALDPGAAAIDAPQLDAYELAMLNAGPDLAITSAAVKLRRNLVVRPGRRSRTFIASGRLDPDAPQLEHQLFGAVRRAPGISAQELLHELGDCEALRQIVAKLSDAGLLQSGAVVSRLRRLRFGGAALAMVGIALTWAISDREPNAVAVAAVMTMAVAITTVWLARARPRASAHGRALLQRSREQHTDLRASAEQSQLALAVALFGGAAMWTADASFASAWGISKDTAAWWSGGTYGYGGCGGCGGCG